jgi:hypothetical protein
LAAQGELELWLTPPSFSLSLPLSLHGTGDRQCGCCLRGGEHIVEEEATVRGSAEGEQGRGTVFSFLCCSGGDFSDSRRRLCLPGVQGVCDMEARFPRGVPQPLPVESSREPRFLPEKGPPVPEGLLMLRASWARRWRTSACSCSDVRAEQSSRDEADSWRAKVLQIPRARCAN